MDPDAAPFARVATSQVTAADGEHWDGPNLGDWRSLAKKSHASRRYSVPSIQLIFEEYDGRMVAWVVGWRRMDDVSYAPQCLYWTTCPIRTRDEAPACQNARNANPLCCSGVRLGLLGRGTDTHSDGRCHSSVWGKPPACQFSPFSLHLGGNLPLCFELCSFFPWANSIRSSRMDLAAHHFAFGHGWHGASSHPQ